MAVSPRRGPRDAGERERTGARIKAEREARQAEFRAVWVEALAQVVAHAGHEAGDVPRGARLRVEQAARSLAMVKLLWAEAERAGGPVNRVAREVRPVTRELERWMGRLDGQLVALGTAPAAREGAGKDGPFDAWLAACSTRSLAIGGTAPGG